MTPHPRPVLDHTSSANFMDSRARHPNRGNLDRGVRDLYDASELWGWAAFVWGYALVWFLINDRLKLMAYRVFDPIIVETKQKAK